MKMTLKTRRPFVIAITAIITAEVNGLWSFVNLSSLGNGGLAVALTPDIPQDVPSR